MKLNKQEQKFKDLMEKLPANSKYDFTPMIQKADEVTFLCQFKIELLREDIDKKNVTDKKVTVNASGRNVMEVQYNALKLAMIQLKLL